nr:helix-turn-helix domain-containing protein [Mycolicibacterium holsaticum]
MTTRTPTKGLITIQAAAEMLAVDPRTIRRWIAQGRLKARRVGPKLIRVELASVEAMGQPVGGGSR